MQINWFTVIAQAINFLVLVWMLEKFLYKPILKAVYDREKKIATQIEDAAHLKAEAKKEQDDFAKKNTDFDVQKKAFLDKAIEDANMQRNQLFDKAKTEAAQLSEKLAAASKEKQQTENIAIAEKILKGVYTITRKALTEIASESLEEQSANIFIKRLAGLNDEGKKQFSDAFASNANTILIRSAFDLPVKKQDDIIKTVDDLLGAKAQLQFKTAPGIISGIELTSNGYKLAWSFSAYLTELEKNMSVMAKDITIADRKKKTTEDNDADTEKKTATEKKSIAVNGSK